MVNNNFWRGKKVLITGHTGFKGSWLSLWLLQKGAILKGYALEPNTQPSLYNELKLDNHLESIIADIRDKQYLEKEILIFQPDIILHLAAQPLVRYSYQEPVLTWDTNVMGTMYLLEAARKLNNKCAIIIVTTDKVYENFEKRYAYEENDLLGGYDPYSSSKAATEILVSSWRRSFINNMPHLTLASARAGNVIGGGDWSVDRIIPDIVRTIQLNQDIEIRNPNAVRPWQHVLEPLSGYLLLAENIYESDNTHYQDAFNFGPYDDAFKSVEDLLKLALKIWPGNWVNVQQSSQPHEAGLLMLSIKKAESLLDWKPKWNFNDSVTRTINWYKNHSSGADAIELTLEDIKEFES